jgi:hypothetical protein
MKGLRVAMTIVATKSEQLKKICLKKVNFATLKTIKTWDKFILKVILTSSTKNIIMFVPQRCECLGNA